MLADGLTYARQLGATHLIDAATLTGACVVALGMINAGGFSNDDETYAKFDAALGTQRRKVLALAPGRGVCRADQERHWRHQEHRRTLGRRITAAEFLKSLSKTRPWIHLDIAGLAWVEDSKPYIAKGPSGIAVRSILEWVRSF